MSRVRGEVKRSGEHRHSKTGLTIARWVIGATMGDRSFLGS
ncbi:hypothetical protein [Laspinema olomoucense]|nr:MULTISPECIES: hypothetical protein [unclassified Laspinema]